MEIELTGDQRVQVNRIYRKDKSHAARQRAHAIILLAEKGKSINDVANILGVCRVTVYNWAIRWIENGTEGLYDCEGRGRNPIFSASEEILIVSLIEKNPNSMRQLVDKVEEATGKKVHIETLRKIAKKHGKVWKRKRKILKGKPDEEAYKQGKADIEELKLLSSQGDFDLVYFDASGVSLQPVVPYAWQNKGRDETLTIPSSGSKRINLLGFLNPAKNEFTGEQIEGNINSDVIIEMVDNYCEEITHPAVVVIDNAPVHTSKKVSNKIPEWETKGVTLYFLPKYSPELNLIEIFWRMMKYKWIPSSAYESIFDLKQAIEKIFLGYGSDYQINFNCV